jgi:hypothetical protein
MLNLRTTLFTLALVASAVPAAYADNFVSGEIGYQTHATSSTLSREQVINEYNAFRDHPVLSDGTVMIQGELGAVTASEGSFADRSPATPHTHVLGNAGTAVQAPLTDAQSRAIREQYIN